VRVRPIFGGVYANEYRERNLRIIPPNMQHIGWSTTEFDVTDTGDDYLDMANSFMCVRARINQN
jgi:hypothetical protein